MFCPFKCVNVVFFLRVLQAVLGWKLSVLMVSHTTTTQKLEVEYFFHCFFCFIPFLRFLVTTSIVSNPSESSWDKPADFPSDEAPGSSSGSNQEGESQEEPATPQPEPLSGGEESSNGAPAPQEAEAPEETSQQPKVPKISFRVRRRNSQQESVRINVTYCLLQFCFLFSEKESRDRALRKRGRR